MSPALLRRTFILAALLTVFAVLLLLLARTPHTHAASTNISLSVYAQQNGANVTTVASGSTFTVYWNASNSYNGRGGICNSPTFYPNNPALSIGTSGSYTTSETQTTTFNVGCAYGAFTVYGSVTVKVYPTPTATLSANPVSITQGQQTVLTWNSTNATSCTVDNGVYSGGITAGALGAEPNTTTTYTLTCSGPGGTATSAVTVYVTPLAPNLYPGTPANVTVYAGQPATLSYSVINGGNATSGSFQDIFWIDNSSGNWAGAAYTNAGPIAPGGSQYQSTTYTWNTAGTYVYTECVNLGGGGGPTYTCGSTGTVTVLAVPNITAATGGAVSGTVGVPFTGFTGTVYNTGTAAAAAFPNVFEICDGGCATLNTFIGSQDFGLAAGASRAITPSSRSSYTPTVAATLYYRACGDMNTSGASHITESNYSDNCGAWQNFTVGNPTAPDLTAGTGGAINTTIGNTVGLGGAVYNIGNASTNTSFNNLFQVTLSDQTTVVDNENTVLGALAAGGSVGTSVQSSYTFPSPGTYYYRICADNNYAVGGGWTGSISESNENNNCGVWNPIFVTAPNITAATGGAVSGTVGVPFTGFTGTVYNTGTAAAAAFPNEFQICDSNCATINKLVGSQDFGLAAGASRAIKPSSGSSYTPTSNAQLYYRACGNTNTSGVAVITESSYSDNCGSWQYFTVGQADLTATAGSAVSVSPSQSYTFTGTVTNGGTAATSGGFWNLLQICNGSGSCSTYNDATQETWLSTLANSASSGVSITDTAPSTAGTYLYRICANDNTSWTNTVSESNYSNNCSGWQTLTVAYTSVGGTCSVSPSSNVYTGENVTWASSPTGGNGTYTYQWGGNVSGSTQNVTTSYSTAGSYTGQVLVTSGGLSSTIYCTVGGSGSGNGSGNLVVSQPAAPSCAVSPSNPTVGQTVTYTATPGAGDTSVFNWTGSDGYTTTGNPITRTFTGNGTYGMQVTSNGSAAGYCSNILVGCSGTPTPSLSAASTLVNQGSSDVLTLSGQNVNTSCVLTANGATLQTYTPTSQCTVAQTTYTASNIQNQTKFCYACDGGTPVCTLVNVIPVFNEF